MSVQLRPRGFKPFFGLKTLFPVSTVYSSLYIKHMCSFNSCIWCKIWTFRACYTTLSLALIYVLDDRCKNSNWGNFMNQLNDLYSEQHYKSPWQSILEQKYPACDTSFTSNVFSFFTCCISFILCRHIYLNLQDTARFQYL